MQSQAILIIDGEEAVRDSLGLVLADEGFQCFTLLKQNDVMPILEKEEIAVIILDSELAVKSDLLSKVKEQYPHVKSVVISSYVYLETCRLALMKEADEFILKPLDFDELILLVNKLISAPA